MIETTLQVLYNGPRNALVQATGISDGAGNEDHVAKIVASDLGAEAVSLRKIGYDVSGGVVRLAWDAEDDFVILSDRGEFDYSQTGGVAGGTLTLSTTGFELNSSYTVIFELVKKS